MSADEIIALMDDEESSVLTAVHHAAHLLAVVASKVSETFDAGGRTFYLGSGTSGRIATMDAAEMPPTFGVDADRFIAIVSGGSVATSQAVEDAEDDGSASILALNDYKLSPNDLVIGLAASGNTPFVVSGIRHARQKGVWTCGIANNANASLLHEADLPIFLDTGPEVLTGSTRLKAGTSQKLALNRISTAAMVLSGKVIQNLMIDVKAKNQKLKERCVLIVRDLSTATEIEAQSALEKSDWNIRAALDRLNAISAHH